jgi:glycosyltransferase involved in cell wall biosynthesis
MLNLLFCGAKEDSGSKSWALTTGTFYNHLKNQVNIIDHIDYSVKNRILLKIHKLYSNIFLSEVSLRDPLINYLTEKKFIRLYKKIKTKPDVVFHMSSFCVPAELAAAEAAGGGIHVAYTDASPLGSYQYGLVTHSARYLKNLIRSTAQYAGRFKIIFTFNEWTRKSIIGDFGVAAEKVHNIGFGANLKPYMDRKNYENGLILTVLRRGNEELKGLNLLLQGFKIAHDKNRNLKLAVVGTTSQEMDGVTYYEGFPRAKTISLFQEAALYAMPAIFEPNGMVFPEALSCKTPVLGLNRLAFPEFAGYGKYGFIAEPEPQDLADKILYAMANPQVLEKMGREGQEFAVKRYSWDVVVQKMLDTINQSLA